MPLLRLLLLACLAACAQAADLPVGLVWDERFKLHDTGRDHPERGERLDAIRALLADSGLLPLI